jgi:hypothetical protein
LTTIRPCFVFGTEKAKEKDQLIDEKSTQVLKDKKKQQRWATFPIIASSPETGIMLGGMLFHFFPTDKPDQQASTIDVMAYGTTEE